MTKQIAKTGRQAKLATKKGIEPIFAPARARRTFDDVVKQIQDDLYDGLRDEVVEGVDILLERGWEP